MFDTVRAHRRILLAIILLLIMPAFVFFGVSGYDRMFGSSDDLAVVDGQPVTRQAVEQAHRQQLDRLREMAGEQFDVAAFDTPQARQQTLQNLITQQALLGNAHKERIQVTDAAVRDAIASNPALHGPDGQFDYDRYRLLLAQQGLSPAAFEGQVRQDLALQMLGRSLQASVIYPQAVIDRVYDVLEERRTVRVRAIDAKAFEAEVKPTDEQIKAWYDSHPARFQVPEAVDVETLVLDRSAIKLPEPTEEELKAYYDQNKTRFFAPAQRRASHILVEAGKDDAARASARAKAETILARVKADPASFDAVARADSDDPGSASQGGDLGYFTRDMMVTPFSDAAFAMKDGEIAGPVESEFGYHVIKLTGIKDAGEKPFAEVHDEIARTWKDQALARRFNEEAETFNSLAYEQPDTLQPAADRFGLKIETTKGVTRRPGTDEALPADSPLADERFRASLFSEAAIESKRNVDAMEVAPGRVATGRVIAFRPASRKPLDEVRDEVRAAVIVDEAAKLAIAEGERLLAAYRDGKDTSLADFGTPVTITRTSPGTLSPDAARATFALPVEPLPAYAGGGRISTTITGQGDVAPSGYQLVRVEKVEPPADGPEAKQRREMFGQQLERQAAQMATQAYVEGVMGRTTVKRSATGF